MDSRDTPEAEIYKDKKQRATRQDSEMKDSFVKDKSEDTSEGHLQHSDDDSKTKEKLERKLNEILEKKDSLHLD